MSDNSYVRLTGTERLIVSALAEADRPLTSADLCASVFAGTHYQPDSSHVRVHIYRIRRKLAALGLTVEGIYGRGYRLVRLSEEIETVKMAFQSQSPIRPQPGPHSQ